MNKEKKLTFELGMTNVPSDALCDDNALEESVGMVFQDGEHRVIQKPVMKTTLASGYRLLIVHKLPTDEKNYIVVKGTMLYWRSENGIGYNSLGIIVSSGITTSQISVIGKTIIVATLDGLKYAVWQNNTYKTFGRIPAPHYRFYLVHNTQNDRVSNYQSGSFFDEDNWNRLIIAEEHKEGYSNAVVGAYSENKKDISRRKGFCEPFFVRMAVELTDGSYTHISQPILMLPSMIENSYSINPTLGDDVDNFTLITQYSRLYFYTTDDNPFSGLEDLVKGIAVFVSDGISIYDTNNTQKVELYNTASDRDSWSYDGVWSTSTIQTSLGAQNFKEPNGVICHMLKNRPYSEIVSDLRNTSVFYKIATIDPYSYSGNNYHYALADLFDTHTLENLTTQGFLKNDDYHSFAELYVNTIYEYNSRINVAGLSRSFFEGFDQFSQMPRGNYSYQISVRIKGNGKSYYVKKTVSSPYTPLWWFYYPDPRADWVTIRENNPYTNTVSVVLDTKLTSHEGLNGSFYFRGMPAVDHKNHNLFDDLKVTTPSGTIPSNAPIGGIENLPNQIATSEMNAPWVFNASGYNTIGNGRVLAMCTLTQALSQGQFGTYPLVVFCTDGIWAMSVDRTGMYDSIVPMSREVCNNTNCIVQTDDAVFFSSAKGLMLIGEHLQGRVKCISDHLQGRVSGMNISETSLADYMKGSNAFMAYDYRDSLLWIFNRGSGWEDYCYVYSIKSGTFSKFRFDREIDSVVNDYPDYLLQDSGGNILSLLSRPDINSGEAETESYQAVMTSRPMKFGSGVTLKSIMDMRVIRYLSDDATLSITLEASNDLKSWRRLKGLRSRAWKYYKMTFTFESMKATDRFGGIILEVQERRTGRMR